MVPGQMALIRMPRSVIGSPARESDETAEGGAVDDGAAALGPHLAQLMFHASPHTSQVDRIDPVKDLSRFVCGVAGWDLDAGVVERHIEPAERVDGRLHHGRHAVLVGHVTTNPKDLVASGCQLLGGRIKRGLVDVGDDDGGPGLCEPVCGGKPHAGAPTRHECYLSSEVVGRVHGIDSPFVDQLRSIVTWKLSSCCSISSIVVSNRPIPTMPFQ
jgi:hypothetical protein